MNESGVVPSGADLVFLKLGGSLITDKSSPRSPRQKIIERLSAEIAAALKARPHLRVLLGHGSGSFGHFSGSKHHTRDGVRTAAEWRGFSEVWKDASDLNRLVMEALFQVDLPAVAFPPSAALFSANRAIQHWNLDPIQTALERGLLPVVYGDVAFDSRLGGTILSTEDLFTYLAPLLKPGRILLAGRDPGVWQDYPDCTVLFDELTPATKTTLTGTITRSADVDVTGGMADKVDLMLDLVQEMPSLEVVVFSGEEPGSLQRALLGNPAGTRLHS